ncbi:uncharacterized protein LOC130663876 isoform X1 [Microplitis mediator]|uniref:uncharacterized protein LOC130663876 isoform X1 n=1 Tax=Microplitis mediator TaxID=375433 RepID=UPI002553210F|nr:uncharacterized protein LOC130663876 isoform X1 [Microplitis mediator]
MIIINLLPFLLAARLESAQDPTIWKRGAEVTYLVQSHALKTYPMGQSESKNSDMIFDLKTMLTCQSLETNAHCFFHDTESKSAVAGENKHARPDAQYIERDIWTKKVLQQDTMTIDFTKNGITTVWVPKDVDPIGRNMMAALAMPLNIGLDFPPKITGNYETKANSSKGNCLTKFLVTRSPAASHQKKLPMDLFLVAQADESINRPIEITRMMEVGDKCHEKFFVYSFYANRELRDATKTDVEYQLNSFENFMTISNANFTSFSKVKVSITDHRYKSKYTLEESISLTLQKIDPTLCEQHKYDEFNKDCSSEEITNHAG